MTNRPEATRVSYPAHNESHLSEAEALRITHLEDRPELAVFVAALGMRKPVSTDKIAFLLEHMKALAVPAPRWHTPPHR
jgi:hypothetical protein